ncbi:MAG: NTP transferase domain-containing protein [Gemmatimonadota bacterium]|nr:MAG: NTP transferase domain-containing protein [Gemmatimonadota bacterium]
MDLTLVVLAAGLSTRYGRLKQLEPLGPGGAALLDYGLYDARRAGYDRFVLVVRPELEPRFREHLERIFSGTLRVGWAHQQPDDLPAGCALAGKRSKPWGTGHAVLAAREHVDGPFVVMNADDFYGAEAYAALGDFLRHPGRSQLDFAAAGYRLRDTLSPHGGVSRALCELDDDGYLRRVVEVKNVGEEGGTLGGRTLSGRRLELTGEETISMNLWGAEPAAFPLLQERFAHFLDERGADPDAEFLLSEAVNELIAARACRVKVIPASGPWLGVTYQDDRPHVEARLQGLVAAGQYPAVLSSVDQGQAG